MYTVHNTMYVCVFLMYAHRLYIRSTVYSIKSPQKGAPMGSFCSIVSDEHQIYPFLVECGFSSMTCSPAED